MIVHRVLTGLLLEPCCLLSTDTLKNTFLYVLGNGAVCARGSVCVSRKSSWISGKRNIASCMSLVFVVFHPWGVERNKTERRHKQVLSKRAEYSQKSRARTCVSQTLAQVYDMHAMNARQVVVIARAQRASWFRRSCSRKAICKPYDRRHLGACKWVAFESHRRWCHAAPQHDQVKIPHDVTGWSDITVTAVLVFLEAVSDHILMRRCALLLLNGKVAAPFKDSLLYHLSDSEWSCNLQKSNTLGLRRLTCCISDHKLIRNMLSVAIKVEEEARIPPGFIRRGVVSTPPSACYLKLNSRRVLPHWLNVFCLMFKVQAPSSVHMYCCL